MKLFKSRYFNKAEKSNLEGYSFERIQLFLILASQAKFEEKLECLKKLCQISNKVDENKFKEIIQEIFRMCTADLFEALFEIGYVSEEFFDTEQL